jgi:hypothetical protein
MRSELGYHYSNPELNYRPVQNRSNKWLIDREVQRTSSFTGIPNSAAQDRAVTEGMGPISNRTLEHLCATDLAIVSFRRLLLRLAGELEQGEEPTAPHRPATFEVLPAAVEMDVDRDFLRASGQLLKPSPS